MFCLVTIHRTQGMRLKSSEVAAPVHAHVISGVMAAEHTSFKRTVRLLELQHRQGAIVRSLARLFEPQLVSITPNGIAFQGIELHTENGRVFEYQQLWHCQPVAQQA